MTKIKAVLSRIRGFTSRPEVSRWLIPYTKPLAATIAAGLVLGARKVGLVDLPAGYSETAAAAIVGYLIPEARHAVSYFNVAVEAPPTRVDLTPAEIQSLINSGKALPEYVEPFSDEPLDFHPDVPAHDQDPNDDGPGTV